MKQETIYKIITAVLGLLSGVSLLNWFLIRYYYKLKKTKLNDAAVNDMLDTLSKIKNSEREGIITKKEAKDFRNKVLENNV